MAMDMNFNSSSEKQLWKKEILLSVKECVFPSFFPHPFSLPFKKPDQTNKKTPPLLQMQAS